MKVFIVSDMEGVAGIVKWQQTTGGESPAYQEGRKLYTEEINAAVRGAKVAGAGEIVVMDCHGAGNEWTFNSLIPEDLDPACEFVVQEEWARPLQRAQADPGPCARADRGGREVRAQGPEGGTAVRPREAVRDPDRVHDTRPARRVPQPEGHRAGRRSDTRLQRRRLVDR